MRCWIHSGAGSFELLTAQSGLNFKSVADLINILSLAEAGLTYMVRGINQTAVVVAALNITSWQQPGCSHPADRFCPFWS
jgi:hypothetical protein